MSSFIISLIVLFIHVICTWDGMIFSGIKKVLDENKKYSKPIYTCPICMSFWWGTLIYWLFIGLSVSDWIITVFAAGGFLVIFVILLTLREACLTYIEKNDK